jgi:hypothetical protein
VAKNKAMSKAIECRGQHGHPSVVKASLRNDRIAIRIEGCKWPHLTLDEAMRLLNWLHDAVDEGYERRRRAAGPFGTTPPIFTA